jgi:hypothetical protein
MVSNQIDSESAPTKRHWSRWAAMLCLFASLSLAVLPETGWESRYGIAALILGLSIVCGILERQWILVGIALVPGCAVVASIQPDPHMIAHEQNAVRNLRTINAAEVTYKSSSGGKYGTMTDLIGARLLDKTYVGDPGTRGGYKFAITLDATGQGYTATAVPASPRSARYAYCIAPDAVIRYSTDSKLAPYRQAGKPVPRANRHSISTNVSSR